MTDFRSVSTSAARYQQLSLNPQKLAGQCGKLKCCLNYELDMYLDAIKAFPKGDTKLRTEKGTAIHIKTDVFKQQMSYAYEGEFGGGLIPLHPDRVREILRMNREGKKPADLNDYMDIVEVEVEPDYENAMGQDSLNRFEHLFKKKKKGGNKSKSNNRNRNKNRKNNPQGNKSGNQQAQKANPNQKPKAEGGETAAPAKKKQQRRRPPKKQGGNQPAGNVNTPKAEGAKPKNQNKRRSNNNRRKKPNNSGDNADKK